MMEHARFAFAATKGSPMIEHDTFLIGTPHAGDITGGLA
jgi:hypothetical protein